MASNRQPPACPLDADNSFGPRVDVDCRPFDFTLAFEDIFFLLVPAAITLVLLPLRIATLLKAPGKSLSSKLVAAKLVLLAALLALHATYLVLVIRTDSLPHPLKSSFTLPGEVVTLAAILGAAALSYLEDRRSVQPSDLLVAYFSFSIILFIPRLRTLWSPSWEGHIASLRAVWTVIFCLTALCTLAESLRKTALLRLRADGDVYYSSEQTASFWGRGFFVWVIPFFNIGYRKRLIMTDIPRADAKLEADRSWTRLDAAWSALMDGSRHRLLRAAAVAYWPSLLAVVPPRLALSAFTLCQPFLTSAAVENLERSSGHRDVPKAIAAYENALIVAFVLVYTGIAVSRALYKRQTYRCQAQLRSGLISKIFRDMTNMKKADIADSSAVTLMGTNVDTIVAESARVHEIWASLVEIGIATWLLSRQMGVAAVVPTVICLISVGGASYIASLFGPAIMGWIMRVQARVSVTAEMIGEIKTIKMLGFSGVVSSLITRLRKEELKASERFRKLLFTQILVGNIPVLMAPFGTFVVYAIIAKVNNDASILAAKAFSSLSLIALITNPLLAVCEALPECSNAIACFQNVEKFCLKSKPSHQGGHKHAPRPENVARSYTEMDNFGSGLPSARRSSPPKAPGEKSASVIQIHAVGPAERNNSDTATSTESPRNLYSLQNASVRLYDQPLPDNSQGSKDTPRAAIFQRLTLDIHAGLTGITGPVGCGKSTLLAALVGETILVDGSIQECHSIRLGPIAYCPQTAWATDDTVRNNIVGGLDFDEKWYKSTLENCSLSTDILRMDKGDQTLCGSKGSSLSGGQRQRVALARALYSRARVVILDDITSGLDSHKTAFLLDRLFGETGYFRKAGISVVLATHHEPLLACMDDVIIIENGQVIGQGSYVSLRPRVARSLREDEEKPTEAGHKDEAADPKLNRDGPETHAPENSAENADEYEDDDVADARRNGNWEVYGYYAKTAGTFSIILWAVCTIIGAALSSVTTIWIDKWTADNAKNPNENIGYYLGIYALLIVLSTLGTVGECWTFFVNIINDTAMAMHSYLLKATLGAPASFFQTTDTGSVINRFSQDMDLIDMNLPTQAIVFTTGLAACVVQVVIICVVGKYFAATVPVLAVSLFLVQRYYLRTSRQLRLLDIEAKAPIFKLFFETIQGMPTVRLLGWAPFFHVRNAEVVNQSQRPWYMLKSIQQWLALVLDLIVGAMAVIIVGTATAASHSKHVPLSGGNVGVALVTVLQFSSQLGSCFQAWTALETSIGAVTRVRQHVRDTPQEEPDSPEEGASSANVSDTWPFQGSVRFHNVQASYGAASDPTLKGVSFVISPGDKVVLCGSSGSGKSSLVLAMLQMMSVTGGAVFIDGTDVSTINKTLLRERINVVPQEPFFLPGTLRSNLDPLKKGWTDERMRNAIERVGLLNEADELGGLDAEFNPSDWSQGEKQLLCLARALLNPSKLLVLDEAMSSVDKETETLMQTIIDEDFQNCTVLSVLHRFSHVYHYDQILMMQQGQLIESGTPEELNGPEHMSSLQTSSAFSRLYHAKSN